MSLTINIIIINTNRYSHVTDFEQKILASALNVDAAHAHVEFSWHNTTFGFTPGPGAACRDMMSGNSAYIKNKHFLEVLSSLF